jgi:hypothetical protein
MFQISVIRNVFRASGLPMPPELTEKLDAEATQNVLLLSVSKESDP